ncbi:DUF6197 family protein [Phytohabitans kaempferiae]|uniref:Uncharacterized protein n=1 Tax=Phytohabitans kaempferiae TaxID=1620943 RepID=A0ABV6LXT3_9ACTN
MQPTQNPIAGMVITPADTLRGAALYLIRHGWNQGDLFDRAVLADPDVAFPPACGLGAIRMATIGSAEVIADLVTEEAVDAFDQAVTAFADHLVLSYGVNADVCDPVAVSLIDQTAREQLVADWNDDSSRIGSHVIAALKGAADEWDRLHRPLTCCGQPMRECDTSPDVWVFPGDPVKVERVYGCDACNRWEHVEVTDADEKDRLFSIAMSGNPGGDA